MGRSRSWAGFKLQREQVLSRLQLKGTGELKELPDAPLCAVTLTSGWVVIVANADMRFVDRQRLEDLSFDCELVGASIDEQTMVSQAVAYKSGTLEWSVLHDGTVNRSHLQLEGAPPGEVHALVKEARANKKPFVDHVFGVPVSLVDAVLGFDFEGQQFETLVPGEASWRSFRHPDGRVWAIRPGGAGYQLRIGAEHDDPVVKARASTRALRDVEALVAEQLAEGFTKVS